MTQSQSPCNWTKVQLWEGSRSDILGDELGYYLPTPGYNVAQSNDVFATPDGLSDLVDRLGRFNILAWVREEGTGRQKWQSDTDIPNV